MLGNLVALLTAAAKVAGLSVQATAYIEEALAFIARFLPLAEKEVALFSKYVWPAWVTIVGIFEHGEVTAADWDLLTGMRDELTKRALDATQDVAAPAAPAA